MITNNSIVSEPSAKYKTIKDFDILKYLNDKDESLNQATEEIGRLKQLINDLKRKQH